MKKLIVLAACVGASAVAFGQGAFNLNNRVPGIVDAIVTDMGTGANLDGGAGWVVQAFMSTTVDGAFSPVGDIISFRTGAPAGYFTGGSIDAGLPIGTEVFVQVGAWNTNDGASFAEAEAALGAVGWSNVVPVTLDGPPGTPPNLVGLQAWSVQVVPEPSTLALGLLGAVAFIARRRR